MKESIASIARRTGIHDNVLYYRIRKGMSVEEAVALGKEDGHDFLSQSESMKIAYPALRDYMSTNGLTLSDFSKECGVANGTLSLLLYGISNPTKSTIDKILSATLMTYEEAFRTE